MIHSSIQDNWMRVELMYSMAQGYYKITHDSDFRKRMLNGGETFPFYTVQYDAMEKESCLASMVMAWSVITLESLVNHFLADILKNKTLAILAIEYPGQVTSKFKITKPIISELAKKIVILSDNDKGNSESLTLADELSNIRNLIIHDKPFDLVDYGDGKIEMTQLRLRGSPSGRRLRYDDLSEFFEKCDQIKDYILSFASLDSVEFNNMSFTALKNG